MEEKLQFWEKVIAEFQSNLDNTTLLENLKGIWIKPVPVGLCLYWKR